MARHRQFICICIVASLLVCTEANVILIKGGTVVNANEQGFADVLIKDGKIDKVGLDLEAPSGARVIDATSKLVMPGGIDPHTHLDFPFMGQTSMEDFFSGQSAALAGGTTFHIDFALPVNGDLVAGLANYRKKAAVAVMDYGFHMAITKYNDKVEADMATMVEEGINSFKFFFSYKGELAVDDELFLKGISHCKELGAVPMVHGENSEAIYHAQQMVIARGITGPEGHQISRPSYIEGEGTGRAVKLARLVNAPLYVVHVMSIDAIQAIEEGHRSGQRLFAETVAGAVALTDELVWSKDFKVAAAHIISPPLRSKAHQVAVKKALAGGIINLVATDHCGWNSTQKAVGRHDFRIIPNGIHGIQERMEAMWEDLVNFGYVTAMDYVRLTSTECARIFNIYPQKGVIAAGSDADIIVFDPTADHVMSAKTHFSALDTSVFEGKKIKGKVIVTISQGNVVYENGKLNVTKGAGRFIKLAPFAPHVYDGLEKLDTNWIRETFPYGDTPVIREGDKPRVAKDEL